MPEFILTHTGKGLAGFVFLHEEDEGLVALENDAQQGEKSCPPLTSGLGPNWKPYAGLILRCQSSVSGPNRVI